MSVCVCVCVYVCLCVLAPSSCPLHFFAVPRVRKGYRCLQVCVIYVIRFGMGDMTGALDGRSPMPHVDFKKSQCPMSLNLSCPMSSLRYPNVACRF